MKSPKRALVLLLLAVAALGPVAVAEAAQNFTNVDLAQAEAACESAGGFVEHYDADAGGGFSCFLPDGRVLDCTGDGVCTLYEAHECGNLPPYTCIDYTTEPDSADEPVTVPGAVDEPSPSGQATEPADDPRGLPDLTLDPGADEPDGTSPQPPTPLPVRGDEPQLVAPTDPSDTDDPPPSDPPGDPRPSGPGATEVAPTDPTTTTTTTVAVSGSAGERPGGTVIG